MAGAIYSVELPTGEILDIEGPEGLSEQEVTTFADSEIKKLRPGQKFRPSVLAGEMPTKQPEQPQQQSLGKQLLDDTVNKFTGVGQGLAGIMDLPAQGMGALMGAGSRLLGIPDSVSGSLFNPPTIGGALEKWAPTPQDKEGRLNRAVAQGIGGAAGGVGLGRSIAQFAAPSLSKMVGLELAAQPVGQVAAGAAGGGAAEATRIGGAPLPVQIGAGILAGGLAPGAMRGAVGGIEAAANRYTTSDGARQAAARMIARNAKSTPQTLIDAIDASAPQQRSGARPTLAEVTLDPGVAGLQRSLGNSTITGGSTISTRLSDNAIARGNALTGAMGEGDPQAMAQLAEARARTIQRDARQAREVVGPYVEPEVAGEKIRSTLDQRYREAKARTSSAYDAPALQDDPPVRLRPLELRDIADPVINQAPDLTTFQDEAVKGARGRLPPRPKTLAQFIRSQGGVHPESMGADDLRASGFAARDDVGFINSNGRDLDKLRESAISQGYVPEDIDLADFIETLRAEKLGAAPRYADPDASHAYDQARASRDWWRQQFDEAGLDPVNMSNDDWANFYQRVDPKGTQNQPRTLDDLEMQDSPGKIMGPFQKTIMSLRDRYFGDGGAEAPHYMRAFFDDVIGADQVGLKTIEGWERRAYDMASKAPDRQTAAFMQGVGRAIGAKAANEGGEARRAALTDARGVRAEQGDTFETRGVGKALGRGDYGRFEIPDAKVGSTLIPKGREGGEAVQQLAKAAGNAPAAQALRAEVRRALDDAGNDPAAVARVASTYREALRGMPEVAADLRGARAQAVLARSFERSHLGRLIGDTGRDPNATVAFLLNSDDNGRALRRFGGEIANSPAATEGLRRSIGRWIGETGKTTGVDENLQNIPSTPKLIKSVETVLKRTQGAPILAGSQRALLNTVRRELRADQFARSANRAAGSDTARNIDTNMGILRLAALMPGGDKAKTAIEMVMKIAGRADMLRDVLAEAMIDPKFAADLLRQQHPDRMKETLSRIQSLTMGSIEGSVISSSD